MAKILWIGDAGAHTGFARVTHEVGDRLVQTFGHDVHALGVNYRGDHWPTLIKMYVATLNDPRDLYGFRRVTELLATVQPDAVVILNDPQVVIKYLLANPWDPDRILLDQKLVLYAPIDGYNQPPAWQELAMFGKWVAFTKFAAQFIEAPVVYHGVNSNVFRPVSEKQITMSDGRTVRTKREAKAAFGYDPDSFVVLRVDRNSIRKNFPDSIKALSPFMKKHRDVIVHFHCMPIDQAGYNLAAVLDRWPDIKDRFYFAGNIDTFRGWPENDLAALYNAADVFLSTSWGEGFGLTLAEAAACGVPIIAQDCSAITEVVGPGGILLAPEREQTVPSGEDQMLPSIPAFTEALERMYLSKGLRRELGDAGRQHVKTSFSWDVAARKFDECISELVNSKPSGVTDTSESEDAVFEQL
jgi:glycosyltransferase involved in cell wall biosynthesis